MSKGHPMFRGLLADLLLMHEKKAADYGLGGPLGNFWKSRDLGVDPFIGILVRLSDKFSRICQLSRKGYGECKDEQIEDTLMDLAAYALLAVIVRKELQQMAKLEEEERTLVEGR